MSPAVRDMDASELATWLDKEAGERLWTVDGEARIAGMLNLPCTGRELAAALKGWGGQLRVFAPRSAQTSSSSDDLAQFANQEDGGRVFEVAWLSNGAPGEHWVLVEDTFAEKAEAEAQGL